MALTHQIDTDKGVIFATATGSFSTTDLIEHMKRVMQDPAFDIAYGTVFSIEQGTRGPVMGEWRQLGELLSGYAGIRKGTKWACVVPDGFSFGLARVAVTTVQPRQAEIRVFYSQAEAVRWVTSGGD